MRSASGVCARDVFIRLILNESSVLVKRAKSAHICRDTLDATCVQMLKCLAIPYTKSVDCEEYAAPQPPESAGHWLQARSEKPAEVAQEHPAERAARQ